MLNQFNRWIGVSCTGVLLCSVLLWGCGGADTTPDEDSDGSPDVSDESTDSTGNGDTGGEDTTDTTGTTDEEDSSDTTDTGNNDEGTQDNTDETSSCNDTLIITFDLTGSRFRVDPKSGLAQTAEEEIGPGRIILRFDAADDLVEGGGVTLLEYANTVAFSISDVDTAMETSAGPDVCGSAMGSLSGTTLGWSSALKDYKSEGTVTCNAGSLICGIIGMEEGVAEERNSVQDLDIGEFVFDSSLDSFEMDWVQVTDDDDATTFLKLSGVRSTNPSEQPVCEVAPDCP